MAIQFHPLPAELFPAGLQPYIKRHNVELREIFGLEGTIRQPLTSRKSDLSVTRRGDVQVDVSRITPSITQIVSGQSTVVGTPAFTFSTTNAIGSTTTAVSINSTIAFPQALMSVVNPATVTLTYDGALTQKITGSIASGILELVGEADAVLRSQLFGTVLAVRDSTEIAAEGADSFKVLLGTSLNQGFKIDNADYPAMKMSFSTDPLTGYTKLISDAGGEFVFQAAGQLNFGAGGVVTIQLDPSQAGQNFAAVPYLAAGSVDLVSRTIGCWGTNFPISGSMSGVWTGNNFISLFDGGGNFGLSPDAGSGAGQRGYGARFKGPSINSANGTWVEAGALHLIAANTGVAPTVTLGFGAKIEWPRVSTTTQIGVDMLNAAGGQTPTDRIGVRIQAITRGTNRYGVQILADSTGTPTNAYGLDVAARTVGTNRWALRGADKIENTVTDIITSASAKGLIVKCSDDTTRYVRIRALYNGGAPSITLDDVGTTLPTT